MVAVCICAVSDIVLVVLHARPHVVLQTICWTVSARLAAHCKLSGKARMSVLQGNVGQSCRLPVIYHLHLNTGVQLPVCWAFWPAVQLHQNGRILPSFWVSLLVFVSCQCMQMTQALPRLLWELGSTKPATSHMALGLLHSALRFGPEGSALSDVLDGLQPQLCPLYCSLLAPKPLKGASKGAGAVAKAGKMVVPGPLAQLPTTTQVTHLTLRGIGMFSMLG